MKNDSKTRKNVPEISSFAFSGPSFRCHREPTNVVRGEILRAYYSSAHGLIEVYGEERFPFLQLTLTVNGRYYHCTFEDWPSDVAIRRRCHKFAAQVREMVFYGLRKEPFGQLIDANTAPGR